MSAISAVNKVLPPPSPFGELLRRSRFASYDPDIRQAYSAPPSYIHRGNWGLKRPIANRHRKGHIVLRKFEEHAQYIEWDRADSQVKFIRRIEELNTAPKLTPNSPWFTGLGQAATARDSGLDSDFCPGESSEFERYPDERRADEFLMKSAPTLPTPVAGEGEDTSATPTTTLSPAPTPTPASPSSSSSGRRLPTIELDSLGNRGKGAYGAHAPPPKPAPLCADETRLQPNIHAMTPAEFKKYVEKLRKLRPEFLKYLREQLQRDRTNNRKIMSTIDPQDLTDEELVLNLGMEAKKKNLHMAFLGRYSEEHLYNADSETEDPAALANAPQPIRKQPHKFGGLVYALPSELESFYSARPQPGFVLQDHVPSSGSFHAVDHAEGEYIAAFAGLTSKLRKKDAGSDVKPLYEPFSEAGLNARRVSDPTTGRVTFNTEDSERKMRVVSLHLEETPKAVGASTSNRPLSSTRIRSSVVVDNGVDQNWRENPYAPGSREYNALMPPTAKPVTRAMFRQASWSQFGKGQSKIRPQLPVNINLTGGEGKPRNLNEKPNDSQVIKSLADMIRQGNASNGLKKGLPFRGFGAKNPESDS